MNVDALKGRARSLGRESVATALRWVPPPALDRLRQSFPTTSPTTLAHRVERRLLEVARHRGIPAGVDSFALVDNPSVSLVRADSFVTERSYWFGETFGYEPGGIFWWRHFCKDATNILELGANIGYYTVQGAAVAAGARYVAVEPHPGCAATCRRNLDLNDLHNVDIVEAAAVGAAGATEVTLMLPGGRDHYAEAPCTGFVGRNDVHRSDAADPSYKSLPVPAVELRDLMAGVDLFKLDVEGQEYDLLSSIAGELRAARPTIFLEVLDGTPNLRSFVADLCRTAGYGCYIPTLERLVPVPVDEIPTLSVSSRRAGGDVVLTCHPPG
jgi:FkbM family methyltransferase